MRILCLHGYNNHAASFEHMTQPFRLMLPPGMAQFDFMGGPYEIDPSLISPEKGLTKLGFTPPFRSWNHPFPTHFEGSEHEAEVLKYAACHQRLEEDREYHYIVGIEESVE